MWRSSSGFRLMEIRPLFSVVLMPSAPMNDERLSTAGSCKDDLGERLLATRHVVIRDRLRCLRDALNHARVLHREEPLGDQDVENDREHKRGQQRQAK